MAFFMLPIRSINTSFHRIQPIWTRFSSSTSDFIRPPGPVSHWTREEKNAYKRWRYHNAPEYRQKILLSKAKWHKAHYQNDPVYRQRRHDYARKWSLERYNTDSVWRARQNRRTIEGSKVRYANSSDFRASQKKHSKAYYTKQHNQRRNLLRAWVVYDSRYLRLTWPEHTGVYSEEKTKHVCSTCAKGLNRKLWWKRREDQNTTDVSVDSVQGDSDGSAVSEKYDCHLCFTNDWSRALPIDCDDVPKSLRPKPASTAGDNPMLQEDKSDATGP